MDSTETKEEKKAAAHEEQLPWELIEEILYRVPLKSLVRLSVVCKRWNIILDDKRFINNHKETFRFILATESKIYSVSIDPKIVVRELPLDTLGLEYQKPKTLVDCDEFLICNMDKGAFVWNPWLKQSECIAHPSSRLEGICYNGSNRRSEVSRYKTIWYSNKEWKIHDFAFGTWKNVNVISKSNNSNQSEKQRRTLHSEIGVFLNGSLFWIYFLESLYSVSNFNFSKERFYRFCDLPCGKSHVRDALVLRSFKGDRFSLLKQCNVTKKTEIWVTKNKVNVEDGRDVVWVNFITLSIPSFPSLVPTNFYSQQPSYFIEDKRLVVCSCDETGQAWIYVFGESKLINKVRIDSVVGSWPLHCTYFPSLVPVPRGQKDEDLQV
ncbi:F-box protein [Raphanus sativus]|uniref:F-box protein At2g14710-like n=1 Tax=Raphanus sativus TaxID=3726 RepID=A0A6J0NEG9_RAPSA|nr:F-box protein At2g14710-like [Raphanus sativus]KAJ4903688.1 F-box protein [Raphanus sativus]